MEDDDINMLQEYSYSSVGEPFSLNVQSEPGPITFNLTPADGGDGTTFNLTPADGGDGTTFNLTPAVDNYNDLSPEGFSISGADDVQNFNLGQTISMVQPINVYSSQQHRVVSAHTLEAYQNLTNNQQTETIQFHQQSSQMHQQQPSTMHHQSSQMRQPSNMNQQQPSPMYQQSSNHHQQPHLQPIYSRELSNTINAMTFTPPIQPGTTSTFTPDFSSFLPLPPSPSNLPSHQSDPPRISLAQGVAGDPANSLHSVYGLSNTISITRKQKISPPLISPQSPIIASSTITPPAATPPINIPVQMSSNPTSPRIISPPHSSQYAQVSPRPRGPHISPGASRCPPPSPVSTSRGAPPSPASLKCAPPSPVNSKHAPPSPASSRCAPPSPVSSRCVPTSPRVAQSSPGSSPSRSFLSQPSPGSLSMSPPKQATKTQITPPEPQAVPPPPQKVPPVLVPQEIIDPKDIPGVLMKKGNVDIGVFVSHIIQHKHPAFADGESFAERCLTCIIRKMKNSLPALNNLEKATRYKAGDPDPGCVLIPRMKDGRITIAKTGAGVGGNKKIYPHLALVQIFRAPEAQNYSMLASCGGCTNPFAARGVGDFPDTEKVCISPLHYSPVAQDCNKIRKPQKSPGTTPKKIISFKSIESNTGSVKPLVMPNEGGGTVDSKPNEFTEYMNLLNHSEDGKKHAEVKNSTNDMNEDDYIDFDDGGIDWEAKWEQEAIDVDANGVQPFDEEDMLKEIEYLTLGRDADGKATIVSAEKGLLEKLKVLDDLKELINRNVSLDFLIPQKDETLSAIKKDLILHNIGNCTNPRTITETKFQNTSEKATAKIAEEPKDESSILNLLDDIKGSFERQFDMNLEDFGNDTEEHAFANQEFNITNTFSMTDFSSSNQPDMLESGSTNPPSDNLLQYRSSNIGSSDAMFGGGLMEEEGGLPCIINSWSVTDQPQAEVEGGFLTAGTITQEQFYRNMFDQENS